MFGRFLNLPLVHQAPGIALGNVRRQRMAGLDRVGSRPGASWHRGNGGLRTRRELVAAAAAAAPRATSVLTWKSTGRSLAASASSSRCLASFDVAQRIGTQARPSRPGRAAAWMPASFVGGSRPPRPCRSSSSPPGPSHLSLSKAAMRCCSRATVWRSAALQRAVAMAIDELLQCPVEKCASRFPRHHHDHRRKRS